MHLNRKDRAGACLRGFEPPSSGEGGRALSATVSTIPSAARLISAPRWRDASGKTPGSLLGRGRPKPQIPRVACMNTLTSFARCWRTESACDRGASWPPKTTTCRTRLRRRWKLSSTRACSASAVSAGRRAPSVPRRENVGLLRISPRLPVHNSLRGASPIFQSATPSLQAIAWPNRSTWRKASSDAAARPGRRAGPKLAPAMNCSCLLGERQALKHPCLPSLGEAARARRSLGG